MDAPGGAREPRFGSPYGIGLLGEVPDMYGTGRPPSSLGGALRQGMQPCPVSRGVKRPSEQCYDDRPPQSLGLDPCQMQDIADDGYASLQPKKSPPSNGKKTKGRVKIKMEYIDNKLRRYTTFSKRKTGIMKKAYELSTLTGTQVMLLVASETGHVYTFATRKLQPMITSDSGKRLIQTCLNSPDPPTTSEQRMAATGFEETELTYNVVDEDMKTMMIETSPVLRLPPAQAYPCPCCSRIVKQDHRLPEEILSQQPRTRTPYYQERPYKQYPRQAAPDRVPSLYNAAPERRAHICCPAPALSTSFVVSVSTVT